MTSSHLSGTVRRTGRFELTILEAEVRNNVVMGIWEYRVQNAQAQTKGGLGKEGGKWTRRHGRMLFMASELRPGWSEKVTRA